MVCVCVVFGRAADVMATILFSLAPLEVRLQGSFSLPYMESLALSKGKYRASRLMRTEVDSKRE